MFCSKHNFRHKLTLPHNPQANGRAESAVKNAKYLLINCKQNNQNFQTALACFRNTPRTDGYSPAQLFLVRNKGNKSSMPLTIEQLCPLNQEEIKHEVQRRGEAIPKTEEYENIKSRTLDTLMEGEKVLVKHHKTGRWDTEATIVKQREDKLSYVIKDNNRHTFIRERRLLKPTPRRTTSDRVLRSHQKAEEKEETKPVQERRYPQHTRRKTVRQ